MDRKNIIDKIQLPVDLKDPAFLLNVMQYVLILVVAIWLTVAHCTASSVIVPLVLTWMALVIGVMTTALPVAMKFLPAH